MCDCRLPALQVWWPTLSWVAPLPSWTKAWKRRAWTSAAWTSASPKITSRVWAQLPGTLCAGCSKASRNDAPLRRPASRIHGCSPETAVATHQTTRSHTHCHHRRPFTACTWTPPGLSPSLRDGSIRTTFGPSAPSRSSFTAAFSTTANGRQTGRNFLREDHQHQVYKDPLFLQLATNVLLLLLLLTDWLTDWYTPCSPPPPLRPWHTVILSAQVNCWNPLEISNHDSTGERQAFLTSQCEQVSHCGRWYRK